MAGVCACHCRIPCAVIQHIPSPAYGLPTDEPRAILLALPRLCFSPPCFKSSFCLAKFSGQRPGVQQEKRRKERLLNPSFQSYLSPCSSGRALDNQLSLPYRKVPYMAFRGEPLFTPNERS